MERELVELFDAAKKAADAAAVDGLSAGGPEVSRCVDALRQLKTFPVTYDMLVSTQVGKKLRPLTKHPREKIQIVASNLLEIWKKIVIEETTRNKKNGSTGNNSAKTEALKPGTVKVEMVQNTSSVKVEKISNVEIVNVEKSRSISRSESVKVERKEANGDSVMLDKTDRGEPVKVEKIIKGENHASGVKKPLQAPITTPKLNNLPKCNDSLRDKTREILAEALCKVVGEADDNTVEEVHACDPYRVAVSVESIMFEKLGRSNGAQKQKYRSIFFNLKDANNPDFRRRVLLGEVKPEELINLAPEDMASDARKKKNDEIKKKALSDCERGVAPTATTDQFQCKRCGQKKTTYYQMQTRSADEPMTTYVTCVVCNNRWKFC